MKKILPILLLLVLLLGCAKVSEDKLVDTVGEEKEPSIQVEETAEPPKETIETPVVETKEKPTTEEVDETEPIVVTKPLPELELTGELKELMDKLERKVKNYKYTYGVPPLSTEINTYSVQLKNKAGEEEYLIRVDLYDYEPTILQDYWDTVFLNPATQEAKIYCLDKSRCQSKEVDKLNKTEEVSYDEYKKKTPTDWAKEIPNDAKLIGPELLDKKTVTKFEYTSPDGTKYSIWLDTTYGLPMQVVLEQADGTKIKHLYRDMKINTEKDADFKPPF